MLYQCLRLTNGSEQQQEHVAKQQRRNAEHLRSVVTLPIWSRLPKLSETKEEEQLCEVPNEPARPYPLWNLSVSSKTPLELFHPSAYGLQHLIFCLVERLENSAPQITYSDRDFSE